MNAPVTIRRHDPNARGFASDNWAGAHPEVLAALAEANSGHQGAYGSDTYTEQLQDVFRAHFGERAAVYPVFNGTGANNVALQAVTDRWGAVVAAATAHINVHECGAPERMSGVKITPVITPAGKLTPELIAPEAWGFDFTHRAEPQVVSISQCTELGTCYTVQEIAAICDYAHQKSMRVHMDGARIANAAAHLGLPFREFTTDVGVDILSFGGTKNGLLFGDAVVVLNPDAVRGIERLRMSSMQLASKMRFISAQFEALLSGDLWFRNAQHANDMAQYLLTAVRDLGVEAAYPVQSNAVFAQLPAPVIEVLRTRFHFEVWDKAAGTVRWMTAFDTTPEDVDAFASAIAVALDGAVAES